MPMQRKKRKTPTKEQTKMMVEDGTERGMDEESVEKVFKAISGLAKKAQDA
jgi:hypothetical protein